MALFEGLLGGGGGSPLDLYGDLFTPEQKAALQQRELSQGLFRMAEKLGQAAQPQRVPVNTLGALGSALGAFGTGSDMTEQALKGMQVAEQVRESQQERAMLPRLPAVGASASPATIRPVVPPQLPLRSATSNGEAAPRGHLPVDRSASNAPPPPPTGSSPADYLSGFTGAPGTAPGGGDFPGATAPGPSGSMGLPGPGMSPFGLPPGQQSGLLPPAPGANPQMGQGGGLLAGLPFDQQPPWSGWG